MNDLINKINLRFESGNSVPVDSVRITREEWDLLVAERDAAIEREQALAAHVEKVQLLADSDRVDDEFYDEDGDLRTGNGWKSKLGRDLHDVLRKDPTTSLARRDLIKQAEAMESLERKHRGWEIHTELLSAEAAELRQRAQALK